jgi:hypothetical protein
MTNPKLLMTLMTNDHNDHIFFFSRKNGNCLILEKILVYLQQNNNMNNKEPGCVYILTNPSFREDWVKITY